MKRAEVTAFLSLIFILLVTFVGGLMESASIQNAKNYRRADVNRAMESVFAEYQKELLEQYDIFALEATYETGDYSEEQIKKRLAYYGAGNTEHDISKIEFLTDNGGRAFYEQVSYYMEHKYGADALGEKVTSTDLWKKQDEDSGKYVKKETDGWGELSGILKEGDAELPKENNPISHVEGLKQSPLLTLVVPEGMKVSQKALAKGESLPERERNKGYGSFAEEQKGTGTLSTLLFGEYLLQHFSAAADMSGGENIGGNKAAAGNGKNASENKGALDYELEYLCEGKNSDKENLEAVARKLMLFRFGINYLFLQSSASKCAEAEALALTLCSLAAIPVAAEAAKQVILLAWAYGESVVDLRVLLKGEKVALVKSEENWQLSLSGLMKLQENGSVNDGKNCSDGISYREYLRILLFLEKKEKVSLRALSMIEQNLRKEHGADFFRADYCVSKIQIKSKVNLRRGVTYQFMTYYGYQ